jgi:integral membrane protein
MPLAYIGGRPEAKLYVGWLHGVLFIGYAAVTFIAWGGGHIHFRTVCMAAIASLVPFGPFIIDRKMKAVEKVDDSAAKA